MNKLMLIAFLFSVTGNAYAAFTCEKIKDKAVRISCIEDRLEKQKSMDKDKNKVENENKYKGFILESKERLIRNFKDPSSVQWKGLYIGGLDENSKSLCGELNAKNSYGAYVGFKKFVVGSEGMLLLVEGNDADFYGQWHIACDDTLSEIKM